jgi:hypothetical protein
MWMPTGRSALPFSHAKPIDNARHARVRRAGRGGVSVLTLTQKVRRYPVRGALPAAEQCGVLHLDLGAPHTPAEQELCIRCGMSLFYLAGCRDRTARQHRTATPNKTIR